MTKVASQQLIDLRGEVLSLGARLIESIPRATVILLEQDMEAAEFQILSDDEFDSRTLALEDRSITLMALHAPVATELRRAVVVMKMSSELERSADLVTNLCKVARRIFGHPLDPRLRGLIGRMSDQARLEIEYVLSAYADDDLAKAQSIDKLDEHLDHLQREFIQAVFECNSAGTLDLPLGVQMAITARFFERIGDHAVNMARLVEFQVTGKLPPARAHSLVLENSTTGSGPT